MTDSNNPMELRKFLMWQASKWIVVAKPWLTYSV